MTANNSKFEHNQTIKCIRFDADDFFFLILRAFFLLLFFKTVLCFVILDAIFQCDTFEKKKLTHRHSTLYDTIGIYASFHHNTFRQYCWCSMRLIWHALCMYTFCCQGNFSMRSISNKFNALPSSSLTTSPSPR